MPDWLRPETAVHECEQVVPLPGGRQALLTRRRRTQPLRWLWSSLRRRRLIAPEVRQAGVLFQQQRHGIAAPRLLAFGQRSLLPWQTESFLLTEVATPAGGRMT